MDPVGYGRFAAVASTGRHNRCADAVVAVPKTSYFPHLMQETICSRASSVGIPTASDAKKVREINDLLLDIMGRLLICFGFCIQHRSQTFASGTIIEINMAAFSVI